MAISSPGVGSGLDINSIVSQLMSLERRPIALLDQKEAVLQAKLTAYGSVKGALAAFQSSAAALASPAKFSTPTASVADTTVLTATPSAGAPAGTYSVEVTQLAQSQKLLAPGQADMTTAIGTGTLTFDFGTISGGSLAAYDADAGTGGRYTGASFTGNGSGTQTVTIAAGSSSLSGIRDAINAASIGVTATIVNDGGASPYRLVLNTAATGAKNSLKISVSGDAALSNLIAYNPADDSGQKLQQTAAAQDSKVKIDNVLVTQSSNTVADAIPGLTLSLLKTNSGSATKVTVQKNSAGIKSSVEAFVKAYNDVMKTLSDASKYDSKTKQAATLQGDTTLRSIQNSIRTALNGTLSSAGGGLTALSDIGVTFQKDSTLAVSSSKLQTAIDDSTKDISTLFAAVGKPTDSLVSFVDSTKDTKNNTYAGNITQLATQGKSVGSVTLGGSTTISTGVNDTLTVSIDGTSATVTLAAGSYTAAQMATEVQSRINGASDLSSAGISVAVTQSSSVLTLASVRYGSASTVSVSGGTAKAGLFGTPTETAGVNVAGTIHGAAASGSGQTLTASTGDAKGLKLKIAGGATGDRGSVKFARGYAYELDQIIGNFLATDGSIEARTSGIGSSVALIGKQRVALERRLVSVEQRFRAQFAALDGTIASMNKTSSFLTQQLANLPTAGGSR